MTTCIDRGEAQHAWARPLGFVDGKRAISLMLAIVLSACGGGGDNLDSSILAEVPAPTAAAADAQVSTPVSPARQAMTEELLDNFEAGMDRWSNWGNAQVVDGAGIAGSRAMRVGTGAGGAALNIWEIEPYTTYRITAQVRVSDASENMVFGVNIVNASGVVSQQLVSISSTSYSPLSIDVKAPDGNYYGLDVFVWKNAGNGYGMVDNITFAEVGTAYPPPPPPPPSSANLLSNPGFEAGMTSWVNWANAAVVDGAGMASSRALRVGTAAGGAAQDVAGIVPGAQYQLVTQARMSVPGEVVYVGINMLDSSGNVVARQMAEVTSTTFQTASLQLMAPANAVRAVVYFWKNAGSGYSFVDDVVLTIAGAAPPPPPPPSTNLLSNPGLEAGMTSWVNWANAVVIEGAGVSGSSGLRVGTAAGGAAQDVSAIVAGGEYQLTARVRVTAPGDVAYLGVNMLDASGNAVAQQVFEFSDTMFQTANLQVTAPATVVKAVVYVWKNASSGYATLDDFYFARVDGGTASPSGPNLVSNPGFENQLAAWRGEGATVVTDAASGSYAVSLGSGSGVLQDLTLVPGKTYRLSAQTKMVGVVNFGIFDANGVSVVIRDAAYWNIVGYHTLPLPPADGSYTSAAIEFTVPASAATATVSVYVEGGAVGDGLLRVDNISVIPL
jgi:hypothetical protein